MLRRFIVPIVVGAIGVLLAAAAAWQVQRTECQEIRHDFQMDTTVFAHLVQREIDLNLEVVQSLVGLFAASKSVSDDEFRIFTVHALSRHPEIAALEWAPVVRHQQRAAVEREARLGRYESFRFTERSAQGKMVEAARRDEYVPVRYVVPLEQNEAIVGFDLASDPKRRAMLREATDTGEMLASGRLDLVQVNDGEFGFLVVQPIYSGHPQDVEARREALRGFLVATYKTTRFFQRTLNRAGEFGTYAETMLLDRTAPVGEQFLCRAETHTTAGLLYEEVVTRDVGDVAGRAWEVQAIPTAAYFDSRRTLEAPATFVVGAILSLFLATLIQIVRGRNRRVREQVALRTRELKQMTQEAERRQEILRSVLDSLADGVSVTDYEGILTMFNPAAERILGQGLIQSGPAEWTELYGLFRPDGTTPIPGEDLPLARAVGGEEPEEQELCVRNPSLPEPRFIRVKATPLRDSSGRPHGGVAVFHDVTERKRSEARLRDSEARFRSIVEATASTLIILDRDRRILEFNPRSEQIFGIRREEAVGRDFLELCVPGEFHPVVTEDIQATFAGKARPGFAVPVPARTGPERTLLWSLSLQHGVEGRPTSIIATGIDITERREAEESRRVRELAAHLQSAREHERQRIAREIHDELGQALTGLKLEVSFLARQDAVETPALRRKLVDLARQIDKTIASVRRLAAELRPQVLDELGLVDAIRWQVAEFERRTGIHCSTELPDGAIDWEQDRSIAAYRIVQEALTNVARHADADNVLVRVQAGIDTIVLEITDDGRGITEMQAEGSRSFGLLGIRERARMFGGTLRISNREGGGTSIIVRIRR